MPACFTSNWVKLGWGADGTFNETADTTGKEIPVKIASSQMGALGRAAGSASVPMVPAHLEYETVAVSQTNQMMGADGKRRRLHRRLDLCCRYGGNIAGADQGRQRHRDHGAASQCRRRCRNVLRPSWSEMRQRHHAGMASFDAGRRDGHRGGGLHLMLRRSVYGAIRPPTVGAAAYNPSADANMVLWLDASDTAEGPRDVGGISVPTNGEDVSTWRDSNNNYDLSTIGGDFFTYNTNSLNGLPGVTFDATLGCVLSTADDVVALNSNTLSIFVLMTNLTGGDSAGRILSIWGSGQSVDSNNTSSVLIAQQGSSTQGFLTFGNNAHIGHNTDSSFAFGTPAVVGNGILNSTHGRRYLSRVEQGTATAWTTNVGGGTAENISIGAQPNAGDNSSCVIYEVIVTTTNLTSQLAGVAAYFTNKWGTY